MIMRKPGNKTHFTKEMDEFILKNNNYETWGAFACEFKRRFARFTNDVVIRDLPKDRLIMKLRSRDQFLKKIKKEAK